MMISCKTDVNVPKTAQSKKSIKVEQGSGLTITNSGDPQEGGRYTPVLHALI